MERVSIGNLGVIAGFCRGELTLVSRSLTTVDLNTKLFMLEKLAKENLDVFPFLEGLQIYPLICKDEDLYIASKLVNAIFNKVVAEIAFLAPHKDIHNLIGSSETSEILNECKQKLKDDSLQILAQELRGLRHHFDIPQGSPIEIRAWFEDAANQERLLSITVLNLEGKNLRYLPEEILRLENLELLCLSNNKFTNLPEEIGNLINLQSLSLKNNKLTSLPKEIGNLRLLETLDLKNNKLTSLPKEIGNLAHLQRLDLMSNNLANLPDSIINLGEIKRLILVNNRISTNVLSEELKSFLKDKRAIVLLQKREEDLTNTQTLGGGASK